MAERVRLRPRKRQDVGYGRPPPEHQFRPGKSGNPKGRPKGSKNLSTVVAQALNERVTIIENGRRRTVTKLEAAVKQIVNKAATGDPAVTRYLLSMAARAEEGEEAKQPARSLSEDDEKVIAGIFARLKKSR